MKKIVITSIRTRMLVIMGLIVFVAIGCLGLLNEYITTYKTNEIINNYMQENAQQSATSSAAEINLWISAREAEISAIAWSPIIKSGNSGSIVQYLASEKARSKKYSSIWYADLSGNAVLDTGQAANYGDRAYFKDVVATGKSKVSEAVIAKVSGKPIVVIAVPVMNNGKVTGVIGGAIELTYLSELVEAHKVGKSGHVTVAQSNGVVIVSPQKDKEMKYNPLTDDKAHDTEKEIWKNMVAGKTGVTRFNFEGSDIFKAYAPIPNANWSIVANLPVDDLNSELQKFNLIFIASGIVLLLITLVVVYFFANNIAKPIKVLEESTRKIADGDITNFKIDISSKDEIGSLANSFVQMVNNLRDLIQKISIASEQVSSSSEELTANATQSAEAAEQVANSSMQTAHGTEQQSVLVNQTLELVVDMSAKSKHSANNIEHAVVVIDQATEEANNGNEAVDIAIQQMNKIQSTVESSAEVVTELGESSKEIGKIVETISNIAGQTNLLALNAAIEAARAGEHGRGFAVVADEVRKLAESSQEAAKQIAIIINDIQKKTNVAVNAMTNGTSEVKKGAEVVNDAGAAFQNITKQVSEVTKVVKGISQELNALVSNSEQIVNATESVDKLSRQITTETENISAAAEEQSASMQEIAASSKSLADLAEQLQEAGRHFKL